MVITKDDKFFCLEDAGKTKPVKVQLWKNGHQIGFVDWCDTDTKTYHRRLTASAALRSQPQSMELEKAWAKTVPGGWNLLQLQQQMPNEWLEQTGTYDELTLRV